MRGLDSSCRFKFLTGSMLFTSATVEIGVRIIRKQAEWAWPATCQCNSKHRHMQVSFTASARSQCKWFTRWSVV